MSSERDWSLRFPSADLARHYRDIGWWNDETLADIACGGMVRSSSVPFRVRSRVRPFRGTIGDVADQARRLAATSRRRGVVAGDVVAFQLPNWAEAVACFYGMFALGVVVVPVVHIYGSKEVAHILRQSKAKAFVTADSFGRQDYLANLEDAVAGLADLETIVVVSTDGRPMPTVGPHVLLWSEVMAADPDALDRPATVDPDAPALIGYTSGTTAAPKGVIHTHRTYLADQRTWATFLREDVSPPPTVRPTASLTASPVSHVMGLASALRPLFAASPLDLMDVWDAGEVLRAMADDGVSTGGGPPFFLLSLLDHPDFDVSTHLPYINHLIMGGAPIPTAVVERANDLGISLVRAYGSTEHPSTTASLHSDPVDKRIHTDGRAHLGLGAPIARRRGPAGWGGATRRDPLPRPRGLRGLHRSCADCRCHRRRRVVRHGRHRRRRRGWLPEDHRPQKGHHHPRWRERVVRGSGGRPRSHGRGGRGCRRCRARCPLRRTRRRRCPDGARHAALRPRGGATASRVPRVGAAEVARRTSLRGGLSSHGVGEDPEERVALRPAQRGRRDDPLRGGEPGHGLAEHARYRRRGPGG